MGNKPKLPLTKAVRYNRAVAGQPARRRPRRGTMTGRQKSAASAQLMEHMSIFAEQSSIKALLQEYMKRVVLTKPDDPVAFLIKEIKENPHVPEGKTLEPDMRSAKEQESCLDVRALNTKKKLLRGIFDAHKKDDTVNRGELLVALSENPTILLEAFPRHATDLPRCIELMDAPRSGEITWKVYGLFDLLEAAAIDTLTHEELREALDLATEDEDDDAALRWASEPGVVDGRDRKDYEASHVPGAISMPYFDLYFEWRSAKYVALAQRVVASGRHVVCYANTGGTEGMGAGRCMRLCNFFYECWKVPVDRMHRLRDGYADWKKRGFPVSTVDSDEVTQPPRYVAAPREEEDDDDGASVATTATTVRAGAALDSALVAERFLRVAALDAGEARVHVAGPWGDGWVSAKCLHGPLALGAAEPPPAG
ncbi:hypothetical protein SO694_00003416 [Aureococcus anophagefferens]|uniref:Rhodanese domain-containing protein n=1 Tax=Aureococcus anophagefferens TaxID=44056 RepID=A0ABR1GCT8_AURAN